MLQWLPLAVSLLMCAAVRAKDVECDQVYNERNCFNSEINKIDSCWICEIKNQKISDSDEVLFISPTHFNGTVADVEFVKFSGGEITKMPKVFQKTNRKQILQVQLSGTSNRVLNSQFFGNSGEELTNFKSSGNEKLLVEADAFQNCKNMESLNLGFSKIATFSPNSFRGLHKLNRLDLNNNQLEEIPEEFFNAITSLKELHLSGNKIEILTSQMFKHNAQLQTIDLRYNKVHRIQAGSFAHLSQLTVLDLSENDCVTKIFKTSKEIAEGLSACYPTTESACVFPQISNGYIISVDDNSTKLPGDLFEGSGSVKVVCKTFFTQIHDKANQTTNKCVNGDWLSLQWPSCHSESLFFSFKGC